MLGLLIEAGRGSLFDRCRAAVRAAAPAGEADTLFSTPQPLVLLGLWPRPERLVAVRHGNPLDYSQVDEGDYLASLPDGLPGAVKALPDGTACLFTRKEVCHAAL